MEAFIQSYGFEFSSFQNAILSSNALFTGSSALSLYLKENHVDPGFEPNNIDIFVPHDTSLPLISFLQSIGFRQYMIHILYDAQKTDKVITFKNQSHTINLFTIQTFKNTLDYIICNFDLNICVTWWDATENTFHTLTPNETLTKDMYLINISKQYQYYNGLSHIQNRIQKYSERGFDFFSPPLPTRSLYNPDDRHALEHPDCTLLGTTTLDIATFEEIPTSMFLKQSPDNIILHVGNQFHGYNRTYLYNYIYGRRTWMNHIGYVYGTPLNHIISENSLLVLKHSDFTIFTFTNPIQFEEKQIYSMHCYTIQQWIEETPGLYIRAENEINNEIELPASPILQRMNAYYVESSQ